MPELVLCPQCGGSVPASAPAGLCPVCLLRLGLGGTDRPAETSDPDRTVDHPDPGPGTTTGGGPGGEVTTDHGRGKPAAADEPPGRLGGYDLVAELGRGGMGVVYKAVQRVADRVVAVKVLPGWAAADRVYAERFAAEVRALANVRHPSVIPVYEVGEADGRPYFSMEYAPNGTLAGKLKAGPLPPAEAAGVVAKLAAGVAAAHERGVLHRDIKPGNVLLAADGTPRLADFGLAKWADRDDGLTRAGAVMGTPSYMAPEQAAGSGRAAVDARTDVWALGATLYELLTGRTPFRGTDSLDTLKKVAGEEPARPRALRPGLAAELEAVCLKCLEKDPARRYQAAQDLSDDLTRWLAGEATIARSPTWAGRAWRRVRRHRKAVALALALAIVGGGAAVLWPRKPEDKTDAAVREAAARKTEAALQRGEVVTLVGTTRPEYQRWVVGTGTTEEPKGDSPFLVFSVGNGLLELIRDPQTDRFRLSAEWRVDESSTPLSSAGVYFGHTSVQPDADNGIEVTLAVVFDESLLVRKPRFPPGDPVQVFRKSFLRSADRPIEASAISLAALWVQEDKTGHDRPWRRVVVDVTPDEVRAQWRQPDGTMTALRPVPAALVRRNLAEYASDLAKTRPWLDPAAVGYRPRGGLGLLVRDGRVFFRNVVLEPLPPVP